MPKISKKRNWRAFRLCYTQADDGWSECEEWRAARISDPDVVEKGQGMDDLIARILQSKPGHWVSADLDIDGRIIMAWLLDHGWKAVDDDSPTAMQFKPLIADSGTIIRIRIRAANGLVDLHDMNRIAPLGMKQMRSIVCDGQRDWRISDDVCVMARVLATLNAEELTRTTVSSNAYNEYLDIIGRADFRRMFPKLKARETDLVAEAFNGGFVWIDPEWRNRHTGPGISVDANSLYPSVALANRLPCGRPKPFEGKAEDDGLITLQSALVDWDIKPDGLPVLPRRYRKDEAEPGHSMQPTLLTMTDIDWQLVKENYDLMILEWKGGLKFYGQRGMFDEYIGKWGERKRHSDSGQRMMAKMMLNSLFGKLGTKTRRRNLIPTWENGKIVYDESRVKLSQGIYMPVAAWINAYGRRELIHAIQANRGRAVYCDTDSMHLIGTDEPQGIILDDKAFGAWKVEKRFDDCMHIREKSYMWEDSHGLECKVSGMPENISSAMDWTTYHEGWCNYDDSGNIKPGLERWLPEIEGVRVRMIPGKYRITGLVS